MPFVDLLKLYHPYISTNQRAFFRCASDRGRGWNIEWTLVNGSATGISTNDLLFPCSYYHLFQFYTGDKDSSLSVRKLGDVRLPSRKAQTTCLRLTSKAPPFPGHAQRLSLMCVDGHSQFARYRNLESRHAQRLQPD
jgi:hypothetical protein